MSTLDDIAQERQRLTERLARIDAERAKLAEQLAELEAAERVFSRFTQSRPQTGRGRRGRAAAPAEPVPAARSGRGRRGGRTAARQAVGLSLGDATLRAVSANPHGMSAEDVRKYLASEFGMQVRPNHLGMALQRHRRSGRLDQRDSMWFAAQSGGESAAGG